MLARPPGWGKDGSRLHQEVPRHRWCLSRADLIHFRRQLCDAIDLGHVKPTDRDPFDVKDRKVGPNAYTVNEQFIKPRTREAGDMSWALMCHPEGLPCELFVTHAWSEGIFEFLDKVIYSWHAGCHGAYICFLSNPQNLDISHLIADPRTSPFAMALEHATHMMVVPNHVGSIYSRLWCSYEAYLAYLQDKVIYTASTSVRWRAVRASALIISIFVIGMPVFYVIVVPMGWDRSASLNLLGHLQDILGYTNCLLQVFSRSPTARFTGSIVHAVALSMMIIFHVINSCIRCYECPYFTTDHGFDYDSWWWNAFFLKFLRIIGWLLIPVVSSIDTERLKECFMEQRQLRTDFEGHVARAACSSENDARNIKRELADCEQEVDEAVLVLIESGMSTTLTRKAASLGVPLKDVGRQMWTHVVCSYMLWTVSVVADALMKFRLRRMNYYDKSNIGLGDVIDLEELIRLSLPSVWLLMWALLEKDQKAFASRSAFNITIFVYVFVGLHIQLVMAPLKTNFGGFRSDLFCRMQNLQRYKELVQAGYCMSTNTERSDVFNVLTIQAQTHRTIHIAAGLLRLFVTALGVVRISQVRGIGPCLARYLGADSCSDLVCWRRRQLSCGTRQSRQSSASSGAARTAGDVDKGSVEMATPLASSLPAATAAQDGEPRN